MKIRSLKLLVEQNNVSTVYYIAIETKNQYIPIKVGSKEYEEKKNYLVYGEIEFIKSFETQTIAMIIFGVLKKDFDIKVFSPEVQALAQED